MYLNIRVYIFMYILIFEKIDVPNSIHAKKRHSEFLKLSCVKGELKVKLNMYLH